MFYYTVSIKDYDDDYNEYYTDYVQSSRMATKDDYLVYMDYDGEPKLSKVKSFVSELEAITSEREFKECLSVVSVKEYNERKKAEIQEAKLIKAMKAQADKDKLIDDMRKKANGSPEMQKLFAEYEKLIGSKTSQNMVQETANSLTEQNKETV